MRTNQIEAWAYKCIEFAKNKQQVEDSKVELKTEWPDPAKAARRIAGHANAASPESILWLIGVDEKSGDVPGVGLSNYSDWHTKVLSRFDELEPSIHEVAVPFDDVTVCALLIESARSPYVVKSEDGGTIQREVPWRDGTSVKTAKRSQLLRLLSDSVGLPHIEPIYLRMTLNTNPGNSAEGPVIVLQGTLFVVQPQEQQCVIARHRSRIECLFPEDKVINLSRSRFARPVQSIHEDRDSISIIGPGEFNIRCDHTLEDSDLNVETLAEITVCFKLKPTNSERVLEYNFPLSKSKSDNPSIHRWASTPDSGF